MHPAAKNTLEEKLQRRRETSAECRALLNASDTPIKFRVFHLEEATRVHDALTARFPSWFCGFESLKILKAR